MARKEFVATLTAMTLLAGASSGRQFLGSVLQLSFRKNVVVAVKEVIWVVFGLDVLKPL
jgi:hypothetical protein